MGVRFFISAVSALIFAVVCYFVIASDSTTASAKVEESYPYFASLKSSTVNARRGPGTIYQIDYVYSKRGMPIEILGQSDNWLRVRDMRGQLSWIHRSLISRGRAAVVAPWSEDKVVELFVRSGDRAVTIGYLQSGVYLRPVSCDKLVCEVAGHDEDVAFEGLVEQSQLWGVYPDETFEG